MTSHNLTATNCNWHRNDKLLELSVNLHILYHRAINQDLKYMYDAKQTNDINSHGSAVIRYL